jgi:hypothetical protein
MLVFRKKYPLDGSDAEVIIAYGSYPVGIDIDIERDQLYWLANGIAKLFRSDLDGSNRTTILTDTGYYTMAIALDTTNK